MPHTLTNHLLTTRRPAPRHPTPGLRVLLACVVVLVLSACSGRDEDRRAAATDDAGPGHGARAGAAELDEPALGLTTIDPTGTVTHLDLLDESTREIAQVGTTADVHSDGRYLFAEVADGVHVVDSGVWTWDHVDHFHYYRGKPRDLGVLPGTGPARVATTMLSTSGSTGVFFPETGTAVLLDTGALADGRLVERFRLEGPRHDGLVVPVGDHALLTRPGDGDEPDQVQVVDQDGEPVGTRSYACDEPAGTIATRVGTVIGCADGALLARSGDDAPAIERIPYPSGTTAPRATSFAGRDGRPTVAALAGPDRVWLLDTRERRWTLVDAPRPLAQVAAVDDAEQRLVAVTLDGRLAVLDGTDGALVSLSDPLVAGSLRAGRGGVRLVVDQQRTYLNAPFERRLLEIDAGDDARVSRTFRTATEPLHMAGTGR